MYVFDTSSFIVLFRFHQFKKRFPSLWKAYDNLIDGGEIISVKEALNEVIDRGDALSEWAAQNKSIFLEPVPEEGLFLSEIFRVKKFQESLEQKKLLKGGPFADPFIIAKAKITNGIVVTEELPKPHAAKIPNICEHFGVKWLNLEAFMGKEDWEF